MTIGDSHNVEVVVVLEIVFGTGLTDLLPK